jgi:hypothetical protein
LRITSEISFPAPSLRKLKASVFGVAVAEETSCEGVNIIDHKHEKGRLTKKKAR